jgi:hypothetical protein
LIVLKQYFLNSYQNYLSNFFISLNETSISETFSSPILNLPQFLFVLYASLIFITFFFNFFSSYTREENTIDFDYLLSSTTVEAEKEITCFEDMLLGLIILVYIFG